MTTLILVGDIMLGNGVKNRIVKYGPLFPFKEISNILKQGDVVFGNLESPLSKQDELLKHKRYTFKAKPESVEGLLSAGFNILSLANNHILDSNAESVEETIEILEKNDINFSGLRYKEETNLNPIILEKSGTKFGFLSYTKIFPKQFKDIYPGPFPFVKENALEDIRNAKKKVDFLIVSIHWGKEYNFKPTEEQKRLAKLMIDDGADIIAGHHPHVLQPIERYKGKLIFYSPGNFVFNQFSHKGVKDSIIAKISIDKEIKLEKIPVHINDEYQPVLK